MNTLSSIWHSIQHDLFLWFEEFAIGALPQKIHEAMVKKYCGSKLAGHISRDSTAIKGREKPEKKEAKKKPKKMPPIGDKKARRDRYA